MVWSIVSSKGRRRLAADASQSRADRGRLVAAFVAVAIYNAIGVLDMVSTTMALRSGVGEEVNPFLRAAMENLGPGWIFAKLFLQMVISAMVLWFPHRLVVGMFAAAITFNAIIVFSNFRIVAGF